MMNKWNKIPFYKILMLVLFSLFLVMTDIPIVNAKRYVMTYLYGAGDYTQMIDERENILNEVSPSYFDIDEEGNLKINYIDKGFVETMKNKGVRIVPFLSNHWDRERGRRALQNYENLSSQIANAIERYSLDGVNIDIENLTELDRENYIELVKKLRKKVLKDKLVVVSVAANPNGINTGWQGSYDYAKLAEIADYIMVMAYDEHYEGGEAGPVASREFVEKSIQYAVDNIEKEKIILGIPLYGRYWNAQTDLGGRAVSLKQMEEIMNKYKCDIEYDKIVQTPRALVEINSTDDTLKIGGQVLEEGQYVFWYEDENSIKEKMNLIEKYDLKGVGMWKIGLESSRVWNVLLSEIDETDYAVSNNFDDVSTSHWAYRYIDFVNQKGLMIGKNEREFGTESSLTRAEFATIVSRIIDSSEIFEINLQHNKENSIKFSDITNHWAEKNICDLASIGLIKGYGNNEFKPDNCITRAEICAIISRLYEYCNDDEKSNSNKEYVDINCNHWAYQYVKELEVYGIIDGYPDKTFKPENNIKRAEISKIILKIYEKNV